MNDNKTIVVETDWLQEIDGMTVQKAIAYLSTLDPSHVLNYFMSGDTHGVEIVSNVHYEVPMSNAEQLAKLEKHYLRQIAEREKGRQYYINRGQLDRLPVSDRLIAELQAKLEEARQKYK